ncbi:DUF5765 domain-containing protein [Rhodobacter sp. Har01]|uniref:DUF5765 domain-containing protein n=1 Tax=Rhodobacter sp. Har01 TaxID=2883999 RepID=UPI001D06DBF1|nr:DUF5765 domain-containing protein [Rhodobacter sp. Har01]MCB6176576.1 DUF5765 domain-containing protein [Rhodobacter sp. Har01]
MCWSIEATGGMVALGVAGAVVSWWRRDASAIPLTILFFAAMEALQLWGYLVIDQCGTPSNQAATALSMLHIVIQPIFINAFLLAFLRPEASPQLRRRVMRWATIASGLMLLQLVPWPWTGACELGRPLCGTPLCTVTGTWHLGWTVPYSDLFEAADRVLGTNFGFPAYVLAVFVMPLFYGAWRFTLFHALIGPVAANLLTRNPNEAPAVWCLTSIFIATVVLVPGARTLFGARKPAAA